MVDLRKFLRVFALVAVLALVIAACGDDSDDSGSGSESASGSEPADDAPELTGEPIQLSLIAPLEGSVSIPERVAGAEAAAEAINAEGGVDGRPIEILGCDGGVTSIDPTLGPACAQEAVDAGVVASVGNLQGDDNVIGIFEDAGIPIIGAFPNAQQDFFSANAFPLQPGGPVLLAGNAAVLADNGAEHINLISLDVSAADFSVEFANQGLAERGQEIEELIKVPTDPSTDVAPFIAQAIEGDTDGLIISLQGDAMTQVVQGVLAAGYDGLMSVQSTLLDPDVVSDLGDEAEGIYLVAAYDSPDSDAAAQFNEDMDNYAPDAIRSEFALEAWAGVQFVADQLATLPEISAQALLDSLPGADVDIAVAPQFVLQPDPELFPPFARISRVGVQYQQIEDGKAVALNDGDFLDPRVPL
jgi:ABC-type branched-subunit amino acid transport system substrate-binding protein